jgi:hypothetical protein
MQRNISVHDNHLIAYAVLAKEKKIVLQTEFRKGAMGSNHDS